MFLSPRIVALAALLALGLLAGPAQAANPEIVDNAKFFSPDAIRQATRILDRIEHEYRRDVVIETYNTFPGNRGNESGKPDAAAFNEWARERARELRLNGIYILICKSPSRFQIEEGNKTEKVFPREAEKELEAILMDNLKKHKPDEALLEGVRHIESVIAAHERSVSRGNRNSPPGRGLGFSAGPMGWICIGLVVLAAIWLLFGLIRAFSGMGGGGMGGGGMGSMGGGGGGFLSSLLGGMLGAGAGMWMYNSFFGQGGSSAWGSSDPGAGGAGGVGQDTDYSGGGGDYGGGDTGGGDTGGGGDWGGGDTGGGGDFGGGGDTGGGGDFGGGGDW